MLRTRVITDAHQRVEWNLTNHTPAPEQIVRIEALRESMKAAAHAVVSQCPESREKALALTAIEEATMWAVAAVARALVLTAGPEPVEVID